jgi:PAS domain-containing protein
MALETDPASGRQQIISSLFDITEQRQAEEALRQSEERYRGC